MAFAHAHPQWFLAQLKPNCSGVAERNLRRQGFTTFLPLTEETQRKPSGFVTKTVPLFPGYIFVQVNAALGLWRSINSTYGITKLVSFGSAPADVPTGLVETLQAGCDETGKLQPIEPLSERLKVGDTVRFLNGPFTDLLSEITDLAADRRVWVLLDILGSKTRVSAKPEQLERV
jgi:transcriptional antiterminator RfaH